MKNIFHFNIMPLLIEKFNKAVKESANHILRRGC